MNSVRSRRLKWLLALLAALAAARAAMYAVPFLFRTGPMPFPKAPPEAVERFRDAKFGLFIHWGPASITGKEIGWSRGAERPRIGGKGDVPVEVYDNLYKAFNPTSFDARQWVALAQSAGMRYLVFTAKHHDGFCMFDSRLTDYKVTRSPFGRDVTAELAAACREAGLLFGIYYSVPDWYHPDYLSDHHDRYLKYLTGQVHELCTRYGPVDLFWFDSVPDSAYAEPSFDPHRLYLQMRRDQPRLVINNRIDQGDFLVYEGGVGQYESDRPWETCIPLGKQWSYKPEDQLKSSNECIRMLVSCAGAGGNLLLGVGPMPTGQIEPRQAAILKQIGQWTSRFGESVFGTCKGPIEPAAWGTCTRRGSRWYVHVLDWAKGPVILATTNYAPLRWTVLTGGTAEVKLTAVGIQVDVPQQYRQDVDTIVAIDVGKAVAARLSHRITSHDLPRADSYGNGP